MIVNHLIIGTRDLEASVSFYVNFLNFALQETFIDTGTGGEGVILKYAAETETSPQLLLVPFEKQRLPNPQHIAFEVSSETFRDIYDHAVASKVDVRAEPPLRSLKKGIGVLLTGGKTFEHFYLLDPSGVNVEIMRRIVAS